MTPRHPSVLVTHAGTQHSYETVAALQRGGMLYRFITSVYRKDDAASAGPPWMPVGVRSKIGRGIARRWHAGIDASRVDAVPLPFYAMRGIATALERAHITPLAGVEQVGDAWFDRAVARRMHRYTGATQVHAFEGTAQHTFETAIAGGMRIVLDVPSAHEYNNELCAEEAWVAGRPEPRRFVSRARIDQERRLADCIISPSAFVTRCLIEHGVERGRIAEIPYGADTQMFRPASSPREDGRFVLLCAGTIGLRKGTRYLLQAWRELALPDAELVLAGTPDAYGKGLLRDYAGTYRWLGHVPWFDLPRVFQAASAFALPSLSEGSAIVTYQAMASALPLVVTENTGAVAADGEHGFVIAPRDIAALKERIAWLYEHRDEASAMGAAGRRLVEQRYTWRHYGERIVTLHRALHENRAPGDAPTAESQPEDLAA